jgi:hypothetical protein
VDADSWDRGCQWMALFILLDQDIDGMFAWKMSDGQPLVNATTLNGDSTVGVHLKVQFFSVVNLYVYQVTHFVLKLNSSSVASEQGKQRQ